MESLENALVFGSELAALLIEAMALIVIAAGSIEAFAASVIAFFHRTIADRKSLIWLRYSRWLIAGLTFQLAADIIRSAISPSWDDIGKLGAVAVIRTVLNYFLERDLHERIEEVEAPSATPLR